MGALELAPAHDVVPADAVEAIARSIRHELGTLEAELHQTLVEVDELERTVDGTYRLAPEECVAVEQRLREFLDDWLRSEEEDFRAAVDAAEARAQSRVRLAAIEAGAIVAAAHAEAAEPAIAAEPPRLSIATIASPPPVLLTPPIAEAVSVSPPGPAPGPVPDPPAPDGVDEVAAEEVAPEAVDQGWLDSLLTSLLDVIDGATEAPGSDEPAARVDEVAPVEMSDAEFQRVVGPDLNGPAGVVDAEPEAVYERFWSGGSDTAVVKRRLWEWGPFDVLLPMLALVVLVALVLLWIG